MPSEDIRNILMKEIEEINNGKDRKTGRSVSKAAAQVVYADRLEMEEKVHELKLRRFVKKG